MSPKMEKQAETVILYPGMGVGHLIPMVALAKLFIREGFSITIVTIDHPDKFACIAQANPSVNFHALTPPVDLPLSDAAPFVELMLESSRYYNGNLLTFLTGFPSSVRAIVIDFFCTDVLDVASQLKIPAYIFQPSPAVGLCILLHWPFFHKTTTAGLKDMGEETPLHFPGSLPMVASEMPEPMLDRSHRTYKGFLYHFERIPTAAGILLNTFEWFEQKAVTAIRDGRCVPDGPTPPVYCIGPVVRHGTGEKLGEGKQKHPCLTWLDQQAKNSVVFLCFGSLGTFCTEQLQEIAVGLENSCQRFLWVVRHPENPSEEPNLDELLPNGFLERTKPRGMVLKSFAPQVEVLQHEAVGGFVTHCGWNSILESVTAGVPMVCWPLYAEQRINRKLLVEEAKIAGSVLGYDKGLVRADEVERKVRWMMDSKAGMELRDRMAVVRDKAMEAVGEGGQSWKAFRDFIDGMKENGRH